MKSDIAISYYALSSLMVIASLAVVDASSSSTTTSTDRHDPITANNAAGGIGNTGLRGRIQAQYASDMFEHWYNKDDNSSADRFYDEVMNELSELDTEEKEDSKNSKERRHIDAKAKKYMGDGWLEKEEKGGEEKESVNEDVVEFHSEEFNSGDANKEIRHVDAKANEEEEEEIEELAPDMIVKTERHERRRYLGQWSGNYDYYNYDDALVTNDDATINEDTTDTDGTDADNGAWDEVEVTDDYANDAGNVITNSSLTEVSHYLKNKVVSAESRGWDIFTTSPEEWTTEQWDIMIIIVASFLASCCTSLLCAYCCFSRGNGREVYADDVGKALVESSSQIEGVPSNAPRRHDPRVIIANPIHRLNKYRNRRRNNRNRAFDDDETTHEDEDIETYSQYEEEETTSVITGMESPRNEDCRSCIDTVKS